MSDQEKEKADGVRGDEVENLNADDLDIEELDEADLEDAAGGSCWEFHCPEYDDGSSEIQ